MGAKPKRATLAQSDFDRLEAALRDRAISEGSNLFPELEEISKQTVVDDIDIDESSLEVSKEKGGSLRVDGVVNVYVTLNYGDRDDFASFGDSYPGHFSAVMAGLDIRFENTSVDTSSFFR